LSYTIFYGQNVILQQKVVLWLVMNNNFSFYHVFCRQFILSQKQFYKSNSVQPNLFCTSFQTQKKKKFLKKQREPQLICLLPTQDHLPITTLKRNPTAKING